MWFTQWFKKARVPLPAPEHGPLRILGLSLFVQDRLVLERLGRQYGWELHFTTSQEGFRLLSQNAFAVILFDRNQPGNPWRDVLDRLAAASPQSCILLVSPVNDDYLWRDVLQHGGYGVLTRPLLEESVLHTINAAAHFAAPAAG